MRHLILCFFALLLFVAILLIFFQMMKDWSAARQRVQDLKAVDPKASEKLNKEITSVSAGAFAFC